MYGPVQRVFNEYPSLVGLMDMHAGDVERAEELLYRLRDAETLFTLCGMLPLLEEMNVLIKLAQKRTLYIP